MTSLPILRVMLKVRRHEAFLIALLACVAVILGILAAKPAILVGTPNSAQAAAPVGISAGSNGKQATAAFGSMIAAVDADALVSAVHNATTTDKAQAAQLASNTTSPVAVAAQTPVVPVRSFTARITQDLQVTSEPGSGRVVGVMPAQSPYLKNATTAWIQSTTADRKFGRVIVPWAGKSVGGWIPLKGLSLSTTRIAVLVDLSERRTTVYRGGESIISATSTIGAPSSPSPLGRYFVTDPVANPGGTFGAYAFGISGTQPRPPAGWSGPAQMAIHGTNQPSTIGQAVSAGCIRLADPVLLRMKGLMRPGTPVIIQA